MMRQNIVFVENRAGSLKKVTEIIGEAGINIFGFACFDAPEFAVFRMICDDADRAEELLTKHGYLNRITPAIVVDMLDEVRGLDCLLGVVAESNVSLDYIYTSYHRAGEVPVAILYSEDASVTESILKNNGFRVLSSVEELKK